MRNKNKVDPQTFLSSSSSSSLSPGLVENHQLDYLICGSFELNTSCCTVSLGLHCPHTMRALFYQLCGLPGHLETNLSSFFLYPRYCVLWSCMHAFDTQYWLLFHFRCHASEAVLQPWFSLSLTPLFTWLSERKLYVSHEKSSRCQLFTDICLIELSLSWCPIRELHFSFSYVSISISACP